MMTRLLGSVGVVVLISACGPSVGTIGGTPDTVSTQAGLTWEQFQKRTFVEPETGVTIADGDTPFFSQKQLKEFYELNVRAGQLIVNRVGSADDIWDAQTRQHLTYCVSNTFGANKAAVVQAMAGATQAWMSATNVTFTYSSAQDGSCTASNSTVLFDVKPVNVNGQYIARSFFPSESRANREVLVDNSAFQQGGDPTLTGVLRHELGHVLGFRHEHTRPEAGTCFEDNTWRALTAYDQASVMHYPQCNGISSWALELTQFDIQGAQALYGAPGSAPAPTPTPSPTPAPAGSTVATASGTLAANATKGYGPYSVAPGTQLHVVMSGTGDADLYVRFGGQPTASKYDCRPYLDGTNEECLLTVPATATSAYVLIDGYAASSTYSLRVEYTKAGAAPTPASGTAKTSTLKGSLAKGQQALSNPLPVVPGTTVTVTMTGSGDPDLYVRFGADPTLTAFDCRPYVTGASENCSLVVPAGKSDVRVMIDGYAASSYSVTINYTAP